VSRRRFEFRLERVRALREQAEDEAKEQLAAAMAERDRWASASTRRPPAARGPLRQARLSARSATCSPTRPSSSAASASTPRRARPLASGRRGRRAPHRAAAAAQERRVLEQLKDKQATEFQRAAERRESELLDELALAGFTRRSAAS
jgi:flagellar FliJ protein